MGARAITFALGLCAVSCADEPTQLLVRFRTDLPEVKQVRVTAEAGGERESVDIPAGPGETISFGVVPPGDRVDLPVSLTLEARTATTTLFEERRQLDRFFEHRKAHVYIFLGRTCFEDQIRCGPLDTCNPCGACEPIVPVSQPSPPLSWTSCVPPEPADAGPRVLDTGVTSTGSMPSDRDDRQDGGFTDTPEPDAGEVDDGRLDGAVHRPRDAAMEDADPNGRSDGGPRDVEIYDGPLDDGRGDASP